MSNSALITELQAAVAVLTPIIRGLNELSRSELSDPLESVINDVRYAIERRRSLIRARIVTLTDDDDARLALEADGYPHFDKFKIDSSLFMELEREANNLLVAISVFIPVDPNQPVSIGVDTDNVTDVPQPRPSH